MRAAPLEQKKAFALLKLAHGLTETALSLEDQDEFWPRLAERLVELFACERVTIFQRTAGDELVSRYAHGLTKPLSVRRGEGIAGVVAETREGLISNDPYKDPRFHLDADRLTGFKTRSLMAVPLVQQGGVQGVIELVNKRGGFSAADLEALKYLGSQIAVIFLKFSFEEKQREMTQQLIQSEKLAAIGRMASGVAHEINNPLAVIMAVVHRLLKTASDRSKVVEGLLKADAASRRIHLFVQNLLGFSRISPPALAPQRLETLIEASLQLVSHEFDHRRVKVVKAFEPGTPAIQGDANALKQVFINLFVNALQAMDERGGGTLTLRVSKGPAGGAAAEVADTGPGIPPELRARIFEPFFTTKPEGQGTGLGLYIIRGILERHKGRVEVDDEPGGGARFRLYFPKAE